MVSVHQILARNVWAASALVIMFCGQFANCAFPEKPIRIIVPTAISGPSDLCIRTVADAMSAQLGQPIVIENISGATGKIGLERVGKSSPDGYTLSQASAGNTANQATRPGAAYDLTNNLKPIGKICQVALTLVASPTMGVKSVEELIKYAKAHNGKLVYGGSGTGSSQHLVGEMFASISGLDLTIIPYRGESLAVPDLASGRIHIMFMAGAKPFIDLGLVVGLATTNRETWAPLPTLIPIGKGALPGFTYNGWNGLLAPKDTPEIIIRRISDALVKSLADEKVRNTIRGLGNEPGAGTPDELAIQIRQDLSSFRRIIEQRKLIFPE